MSFVPPSTRQRVNPQGNFPGRSAGPKRIELSCKRAREIFLPHIVAINVHVGVTNRRSPARPVTHVPLATIGFQDVALIKTDTLD